MSGEVSRSWKKANYHRVGVSQPRKLIRAFQHHFRVGALKYDEIMLQMARERNVKVKCW